jgi:hypothetical protein
MTAYLSRPTGTVILQEESVPETTLISTRKLARMVDVRGGVLYAIQDGISSEQIADPKLRAEWQKLENNYKKMWPALSKCRQILDESR